MVQPERIHGLKEGLRWRWRPTRTRSTAGPLGPQAEMPFCRRQVRGRIERRMVGAVLQRGGPISVCGRRSPGTPHKTMDGDALPVFFPRIGRVCARAPAWRATSLLG